jgi:hypothetical protein
MIEEAKTLDCLISCYSCTSIHIDLIYYENKLKSGRRYIKSEGILIEPPERDEYNKVKIHEDIINKYKKTFPLLWKYLAYMDDLMN